MLDARYGGDRPLTAGIFVAFLFSYPRILLVLVLISALDVWVGLDAGYGVEIRHLSSKQAPSRTRLLCSIYRSQHRGSIFSGTWSGNSDHCRPMIPRARPGHCYEETSRTLLPLPYTTPSLLNDYRPLFPKYTTPRSPSIILAPSRCEAPFDNARKLWAAEGEYKDAKTQRGSACCSVVGA